ncbi:MAG: hypothetical protein ACR2OW_14495 [Methyloligellaceae bacterium]
MKSATPGICFVLLFLLIGQTGVHAADDLCLTNLTSTRLYVALSDGESSPNTAGWLSPKKKVCRTKSGETPASWTVSVFAGPDVIEGCTEIVPADAHAEIVRFIEFDRCTFRFQPKS